MARMIWNNAFFSQVLKSQAIKSQINSVADSAVKISKSIAPVRTGLYKKSINKHVKTGSKRVYAYVYSDVHYSLPVEARHGTMTKTARRL